MTMFNSFLFYISLATAIDATALEQGTKRPAPSFNSTQENDDPVGPQAVDKAKLKENAACPEIEAQKKTAILRSAKTIVADFKTIKAEITKSSETEPLCEDLPSKVENLKARWKNDVEKTISDQCPSGASDPSFVQVQLENILNPGDEALDFSNNDSQKIIVKLKKSMPSSDLREKVLKADGSKKTAILGCNLEDIQIVGSSGNQSMTLKFNKEKFCDQRSGVWQREVCGPSSEGDTSFRLASRLEPQGESPTRPLGKWAPPT